MRMTSFKRQPLVLTFTAFILLCMSLAYWGMQFLNPRTRPVAAPLAVRASAPLEAGAGLFGGRSAGTVVASNYQLKGIVMAHDAVDSAAIIGVDGKPAQSLRVGDEVSPGVTVAEVSNLYVVLKEGGVNKRVELPETNRSAMPANAAPVPGAYANMTPNFQPRAMPPQNPGDAPNPAAQMAPPPQPQPPQPVTTPNGATPENRPN